MSELYNITKDENPDDGNSNQLSDNGFETAKSEFNDIEHLSEKEQKHPVAWKWVNAELTRLRRIEACHITLKDSYAQIDKEFAVYKVSSKQNIVADIVSSVLLALGPAILGLIPSIGIHQDDSYMKTIFGVMGAIFIIGAIVIKFVSNKKYDNFN